MRTLLTILFILTGLAVFGQDILSEVEKEIQQLEKELEELESITTEIELDKASWRFNAGADFISDINYHGRVTLSGENWGLAPSFSAIAPFGLQALASGNLTPQNDQVYDGTYFQAGYNYEFSEVISAMLFYNQYLYPEESNQINSSFDAGIGARMAVQLDAFGLTPRVTYNVGADNDVASSIALDYFTYTTSANKKNVYTLSPSLTPFAGTQNFYTAYFDQRDQDILDLTDRFPNLSDRNFTVNALEQLVMAKNQDLLQAAEFQPLSTQIDLGVGLIKGQFSLNIIPSLVIPHNEAEMQNSIAVMEQIRLQPEFEELGPLARGALNERRQNILSLVEDSETTFIFSTSVGYRF